MCKQWEDINVTCPSISLGVATPHFWLLSKFLHHIRVQVRCWAGNSWYPLGRATLIFSALLHNPCLLLTTIKEMLKFYQNMIPSLLDLSVKPSQNLTSSTLGFSALFPQSIPSSAARVSTSRWLCVSLCHRRLSSSGWTSLTAALRDPCFTTNVLYSWSPTKMHASSEITTSPHLCS